MRPDHNYFGYLIPELASALWSDAMAEIVRQALLETFRAIGVPPGEIAELSGQILERLAAAKSWEATELELAELCGKFAREADLRRALDERAALVYRQIRSFIAGSRLLDYGCGDGMVAAACTASVESILLADVISYVDARVDLPFVLLEDAGVDGSLETFDVILLLTVLHHADDPGAIVARMRALKPRRVIVIESVLDEPQGSGTLPALLRGKPFDLRFAFAAFADWFYNRVLHRGVHVPYNFGKTSDWHRMFENEGFRLYAKKNLGIDQPLVAEVHELLVYDLTAES